MACQCGQLQISVKLKGVDSGEEVYFLVGTLLVLRDVKGFQLIADLSFDVFSVVPVPMLISFLLSDCDRWVFFQTLSQ